MRRLEEKRMQLLEIARQQGGCFTAAQAEAVGFDNANQFLFVKDGRWERVRRGIFRLISEPRGEFDDLHALALFFRRRDGSRSGIFGLETAATIHGLGDFMPRKISLLVASNFAKRAAIPPEVELVRVKDLEVQCQQVGGLPVTSPLKTITDLLAAPGRDREEVRRAFLAGRRQGLISPDQLGKAKEWVPRDHVALIKAWEGALNPGLRKERA